VNHPGDLLSAYLDGELTSLELGAVIGHVAECAECRVELEGLAGARAAVRGLPVLDVPPGVVPVPEPARAVRRRMPVAAWAASVAAAAAVVLGVLAAGGGPGPAFDLDTLVDHHTARVVVDPGISTVRGPAGSP